MFQEFKEAVNNINSYADILDVFLLYYFDQEMLVWYKHLLDNRMALKKQAQIGIFYNLPQDVICRRLQKLQRYIKKITKDLDRNREQFIYLLDYIDKNATQVQKEAMCQYLQRKTYTMAAKVLHKTRQAVHTSVCDFLHKIADKTDAPTIKFKSIFSKMYKNI